MEIKANANGLVIVFDKDEPFEDIYEQISRKLEAGGVFFQTRYLTAKYRGRKLSAEEEGYITQMMAQRTGAKTVLFEADDTVAAVKKDICDDSTAYNGNIEESYTASDFYQVDLDECVTKYHRGTLRSGRVISYDGNVVVIGDINPGAEVEATGNVIVLGNVKGIVHAGASGNRGASVIALNFAPTQLRIADIITNRTGRRGGGGFKPETAFIQGDAIVFEPLISSR